MCESRIARFTPLVFVVTVSIALAQAPAVVDDLRQRSIAQLSHIRRAETWNEALSARAELRGCLERTLGLTAGVPGQGSAAVYALPEPAAASSPAAILVRPHTDVATSEARLIPAALVHMGFVVVEVDARRQHSRLDLLAEGFVPQSFIQRDVRAAIAYLKTRADVDPRRILVAGEGVAATLAAALNAEFAAAVLVDGAPDFEALIEQLAKHADQEPDSCILLPRIIRYAAAEELLSLIAPRPLLLINGDAPPVDYIRDLYRFSGSGEKLTAAPESTRFAMYRWIDSSLQGRSDREFSEAADIAPPKSIELPAPPVGEPAVKPPIFRGLLTSLLGEPVPEGPMGMALNCRGDNNIELFPQDGIRLAATALRPGPEQCDAARGVLVAVDDRGRASLPADEIVAEANRRGWMVWMLDPRDIGESKTNADGFVFAVSLLLGENLAWRQASEILRVVREGRGEGRAPMVLYARGKNATLAASYVAAVADSTELDQVVLRDEIRTFRDTRGLAPAVVPFGALRAFDLPDLWNAAKAKIVFVDEVESFLHQFEW